MEKNEAHAAIKYLQKKGLTAQRFTTIDGFDVVDKLSNGASRPQNCVHPRKR